MHVDCFECQVRVEADGLEELGHAFLRHARAEHEWPFPDMGVRNFAEATQRLTGGAERLPEIGEVQVHPVTEDRIDDWLAFFDHDGFVGTPEWASCYCREPHHLDPSAPPPEPAHWTEQRAAMVERLRAGTTFGYLAYADGRPAGWANASRRSDYALFRRGGGAEPPDAQVVGISCFVIAPPFRQHGLASLLLDRAIADARQRSAAFVEAYPFLEEGEGGPAKAFRGPRSMYDERGFVEVERRERDAVVRLEVGGA